MGAMGSSSEGAPGREEVPPMRPRFEARVYRLGHSLDLEELARRAECRLGQRLAPLAEGEGSRTSSLVVWTAPRNRGVEALEIR